MVSQSVKSICFYISSYNNHRLTKKQNFEIAQKYSTIKSSKKKVWDVLKIIH